MNTPSVWQGLDHDTILNTCEKALGKKLSPLLLKRNSYINRVYELETLDPPERLIVKFYRPGRWSREMITAEHLFLKDLSAQEIPVIPPLTLQGKTLFNWSENSFCSFFPKKGGRALDEFGQEGWEELGRLISRVHLVGQEQKNFSRLVWRPAITTSQHLQTLLNTTFLLPEFHSAFARTVEQFIAKADPLFNAQEFLFLHGDCHKGNLIHRPNEGIWLVDFDDCAYGPPVQDLWLFLPGPPEKCENELTWLLKGYETFRPFDRGALPLVPWLRGMRLVHFVAWLAVQSSEPGFTKHFPEAGTPRYWNETIKELQQIVFTK